MTIQLRGHMRRVRRITLWGMAFVLSASAVLGIVGHIVEQASAATPTYQLAEKFGHANYFSNGGGIASTPDGGLIIVQSTCQYINGNSLTKIDSSGGIVFQTPGTAGTADGQLDYPTAVATDTAGNIYVGDKAGRVQKFDADGNFLAKFGSPGTADGQFQDCITSIAVDGQGNIFTVDFNHYGDASTLRVQKFDSNGNFISRIGSYGSGAGQFYSQYYTSVTVAGATLYTTGSYTGAIQKFDLAGNYIGIAIPQGSGSSALGSPINTSVGANGVIAVNSRQYDGSYWVKYFTPSGSYISSTYFSNPSTDGDYKITVGVVQAPSGFYVLTNGAIYRTDEAGANQVLLQGNGDSSLKGAGAITTDSNDNVYVADRGNSRIQKFSRTGSLLATMPIKGTYPEAIAVDAQGNIYIRAYSSGGGGALQKYDAAGTFLWEVNSYLTGIATDGTAHVYTYSGSIVNVYDLSGNLLSTFGSYGTGEGQFNGYISGIAYINGQIYASDSSSVQAFTPDGVFIKKVASVAYGSLVATDADGDFYITQYPGAISKYSSEGALLSSYTPGGGVYALAVDTQLSYFVLNGTDSVSRYDAVTVYAPTAAPTNITISDVTMNSARVDWAVVAGTTNFPITKYKVRVRAVGNTYDTSSQANLTTTTATFSGLSPGVTYNVFVSAGNLDGYGPEAAMSFQTSAPPPELARVVTGVALSAADGQKHLTVTGHSLVGVIDASGYFDALDHSLVILNGTPLPFCSQYGFGMTAQELVDNYSAYYPNLSHTVSDSPPCYELLDTDYNPLLTDTQAIVVLPADFNMTAQGSISVNGSPTYIFNKTPDVAPIAKVDDAKPINQNPVIPVKPTFSGTATPFAHITVTVHSDPVTCETDADAAGQWSCVLGATLPAGAHMVYVHVVNPDNSVVDLGPYPVTVQAASRVSTAARSGTNEIATTQAPDATTAPHSSNDDMAPRASKAAVDTMEGLQSSAHSWWPWALAGGVGAGVVCVIIFLVRRRRKNQ